MAHLFIRVENNLSFPEVHAHPPDHATSPRSDPIDARKRGLPSVSVAFVYFQIPK